MRKTLSALLAAATLLASCAALPSCEVSEGTLGSSEASEYGNESDGFYPNAEGLIQATVENTSMLGRTFSGEFLSFDTEAGSVQKLEDVLMFNWPASGFEVTFVGTGLEAELCSRPGIQDSNANVFLYVMVDGNEDPDECTLIELDGTVKWYTLCQGLEEGTHTVKVVRKNGNAPDTVSGVSSYRVSGDDGHMEAPPKLSERRIEVFGDAVTCGGGLFINEDGTLADDAWRSYAAYTARAFDAELNMMTLTFAPMIVSLFGGELFLISDYFYQTDGYNDDREEEWDFTKYQPGVVLVNFGTSDAAEIPENYSLQEFEDEYVGFLTDIKAAYPDCIIIAMLGMVGGTDGIWPAVENAAARINEKYGECVYTLWLDTEGISDSQAEGSWCPSESAHELTSEKIIEIIEAHTDWKRTE